MGWPAVARGGRCCRHQVTDIEPAPAPKVIQYAAQAKQCAGCGAVSVGELPAYVRARASYGPETCAQAANLVSGHHIPVYRATLLLCQLAERPGHPLPVAGRRRTGREPLPAHRDRQGRPPSRLQVLRLRGPDPAVATRRCQASPKPRRQVRRFAWEALIEGTQASSRAMACHGTDGDGWHALHSSWRDGTETTRRLVTRP